MDNEVKHDLCVVIIGHITECMIEESARKEDVLRS